MTSSESHSKTNDLPGHSETTAGLRSICWLFPLLLVIVTFIAYIPTWHGGFVWKDDQFILHNSNINFFQGLYRIWFKTSVQYYPLTYTTFWIEYHFWGMNPLGYHLVNIGIHALNAILLWVVLLRLNIPGAWLATAIFALHPVNVESVAWIVERKNTLSGFFFLCSILAGLRFWLPELWGKGESSSSSSSSSSSTPMAAVQTASQSGTQGLESGHPKGWTPSHSPSAFARKLRRTGSPQLSANPTIVHSSSSILDLRFCYWLSFALFVCALFSKTTTIPLPAVILLLVWWKRNRITWRGVYLCIPFVAAGVAVGLITHHVEHNLGAAGKEFQFTLVDRVLLAARNFWFYLGKVIWPHPLVFVYPRWNVRTSWPLAWLSLFAFIPTLGVLWVARKSWGRPAFIAFAYFGGMMFLMLGFFNIFFFRYSFVSDHFAYLACMGPIALFAAGLTLAMSGGPGTASKAQTGLGVQSESPYVVSYGYFAISACILAVLAALTWNQSYAYASDETLWRDTIAKNPNAFLARNNLGEILLQRRQLDGAVEQFQKSIAVHPDAGVLHNLGNALMSQGRMAAAWADFQQELHLDTNSASAYADLGNACLQSGRPATALQYFQKALQLSPGDAGLYYNLGNAYLQNRQLDSAIQDWQKAVELDPRFAPAHNNLGNAYHIKGQPALAIQHWRDAWMAQPNLISAQVSLAWAWATCPDPALRQGPDALALVKQADQLTGGANPMVLRVLAAALAENGQYSEAVAAAQRALQAAGRNAALVSSLQSQLVYYRKNQPFRDQTLAPGGAAALKR